MNMAQSQGTRVCWLLGSAFVFSAALLFHTRAQLDDVSNRYLVATDENADGVSEQDRMPRWFRGRGDGWESANQIGKNHELVHDAFEEVVAKVNPSTARIMKGDQQVSLGTVVRADGLILTKATELPEKIECHIPGGVVREAQVVAVDNEFDLALVKIDASNLTPVQFSEKSAPPAVGGWVATPSGFTPEPVAIGVVSVPARRIRAEMAVLGIELEDTPEGARVRRVMENSGAATAGLAMGDLVLQIDGKTISNFVSLQRVVREHRPGERLQVEVKRGDETISKQVQLTQRSEVMPDDEAIQNSIGGRLSRRRTGFSMALQHDTVLSPRQCGGPLVDVDGKVIGVNIARAGRVATYALPSAVVQERVEKLLGQVAEK